MNNFEISLNWTFAYTVNTEMVREGLSDIPQESLLSLANKISDTNNKNWT